MPTIHSLWSTESNVQMLKIWCAVCQYFDMYEKNNAEFVIFCSGVTQNEFDLFNGEWMKSSLNHCRLIQRRSIGRRKWYSNLSNMFEMLVATSFWKFCHLLPAHLLYASTWPWRNPGSVCVCVGGGGGGVAGVHVACRCAAWQFFMHRHGNPISYIRTVTLLVDACSVYVCGKPECW